MCGGFKVAAQGQSGLDSASFIWLVTVGWVFLLGGLLTAVAGMAGIGDGDWSVAWLLPLGAVLIFLGLGPAMLAARNRKSTKVYCTICGYKWDYTRE